MQSFSNSSTSSSTAQAASLSAPAAAQANLQANLNTAMGCLVITLPILLWLGITAHRKHRVTTLHNQVQSLEKLWLLSSTETLS